MNVVTMATNKERLYNVRYIRFFLLSCRNVETKLS